MAMELPDADVRVATGLAGSALTFDLLALLWAKNVLSDDDALTIITAAIQDLEGFERAQPHPAWRAAQGLLRRQATRFGGPRPGAKPS